MNLKIQIRLNAQVRCRAGPCEDGSAELTAVLWLPVEPIMEVDERAADHVVRRLDVFLGRGIATNDGALHPDDVGRPFRERPLLGWRRDAGAGVSVSGQEHLDLLGGVLSELTDAPVVGQRAVLDGNDLAVHATRQRVLTPRGVEPAAIGDLKADRSHLLVDLAIRETDEQGDLLGVRIDDLGAGAVRDQPAVTVDRCGAGIEVAQGPVLDLVTRQQVLADGLHRVVDALTPFVGDRPPAALRLKAG